MDVCLKYVGSGFIRSVFSEWMNPFPTEIRRERIYAFRFLGMDKSIPYGDM